MTDDALVKLEGVRKTFGDVVAVDGVDLGVEPNSFFSLLGPSGCGKTTCLRMISGFENPDEGRIIIDGRDMADIPPNMRDTNMVFQHLSLFPHMTVRGNVGYGLKKSGIDAEEREARVERYLELVDLAGFGDRKPSELSGGQQQRVALARALVNEPGLLLFDEPLASLDRKLRQHMQVELAKIHRKVDTTFFYVTHDQEVAMTMSDRLAIMRDGKIEQVGTPEDIYDHPDNLFVADFIGDTNLIDGFAIEGPEGPTVAIGDEHGPTVPSPVKTSDGEVTVSIRPEDIELGGSDDPLFEATVIERYFQGDHTDYVIRPNIDHLPDLTVTQYGRIRAFTEDDVTTVSFPPESIRIFDRSGASIDGSPPIDQVADPTT